MRRLPGQAASLASTTINEDQDLGGGVTVKYDSSPRTALLPCATRFLYRYTDSNIPDR